MRTILTSILTALAIACGGGGSNRGEAGETDGADTSSGSTSMTATTTMPSTSLTTLTASTDPTATDTADSTGADPFVFEVGDPSQYGQIDRKGMPAVATALITSRDDYNGATPQDDASGDFADEIAASLTALHAALDDDLTGEGLTPCAVDVCVVQATPLVVPDVLRVDFTAAPGFPNGRLLDDPVMDITLAVLLLDLGAHDVTALFDLPLNPTEGDEPLSGDFPFLAPPH